MEIYHDREITLNIEMDSFFDNRLLAVYEIAIASNILYRLGNPILKQKIVIKIDGYLEVYLKQILESYLSETINNRTSIRYNCLTQAVPVEIITPNTYIVYAASKNIFMDHCILLYSNGLDSLLSYHMLKDIFSVVKKVSWKEENKSLQNKWDLEDVCNDTYIDTFDNDPWDDYALYFIYLSKVLNVAVSNGVRNISIGLNRDDLYGYDIVSGSRIQSQCSQSNEFIEIFKKICGIYQVILLLPLEELTRIEVCKRLIREKVDINNSISCVFFNEIECGMCFSCFDKLTGFLVALAELNGLSDVDIMTDQNSYCLMYQNQLLMKFNNNVQSFQSLEKLPIDYIILLQLNRIVLGEDENCIRSSKFSITNILKLLHNYSEHKIGFVLFPRASALYNDLIKKDRDFFCHFVENKKP